MAQIRSEKPADLETFAGASESKILYSRTRKIFDEIWNIKPILYYNT